MKKFTLLLSLIVIFISVHAQAPVNDEPCGAIVLPVLAGEPFLVDCVPTTVYSYANATLTPAVPNPTCGGTPYSNIRDVWYKFIAPPSGSFVIMTSIANLNTDFVMSIYTTTSCNGTFTEISCNDDYNGTTYPRIQNTATLGQEIYVRIFRYLPGAPFPHGEFKMCVSDYSINNNPVVDNTTKVGIGTQNPLAKLDVAGTGLFRDQVTFVQATDFRSGFKIGNNAAINKVLTSDATGNATWDNLPAGASAWGVNGNNIYNTNVNNVGIGTTLPFNKLTVTGNADFTGNVGIGTNSPSYPLNFANTAGDKISLAGSSTTSYGFGVQPNLMQLHTPANTDNIVFGYGSSTSFSERARIINSGTDGMVLKGRLLLQNGSTPLNVAQTPGVWLYKADNSNLLSFLGTQNNQNVGFYGGPVNNGWGFVYDAINSRVGIGTDDPTSPLEVKGQVTIDQKSVGGYGGLLLKGNNPGSNYPNIGFSIKNTSNVDVVGAMVQGELANSTVGSEAINLGFYTTQAGFGSLSQKMVIMGNGNVGLGGTPSYKLHVGTAANGLRIEGPATAGTGATALSIGGTGDVVIDKPGQVGGRLTIKENGAIAVDGNTGTSKQILTSNGNGSSPSWSAASNIISTGSSGVTTVVNLAGGATQPFTNSTYVVTLSVPSRVILQYKTTTSKPCIAGSCATKWRLLIDVNGGSSGGSDYYIDAVGYPNNLLGLFGNLTNTTSGPDYFDLPAGTHTFTFSGISYFNDPTVTRFQAFSTIIPL
jgi:hypothetical protein